MRKRLVVERARDVLQPLERDVRAFHLPDQRRIGERIQERERLEVDAVRLAREKQRVRLDGVEHRRRRALGDVHVHRAQVLGQDRARRAVVGADVLEHRGVARLLGVVIDDQVHARQQAAEVVRLDVDRGDAIEGAELVRRQRLDLDVQQVGHPQVLGPRHALQRADDGGGARAAQHVPEREAGGHRVGVRLVVQQDQDAVGVGEIALVLLDARAGERSAELGGERGGEQRRQVQMGDLRARPPGARRGRAGPARGRRRGCR